ncbi:MAG TPA: DUF533 domain-containing protein [Thermosynechococcaceae cyanobacterium]
MTGTTPGTTHFPTRQPYTHQQTAVWMRGLLTIAWSDGDLDAEEESLIATLLHQDLTSEEKSPLLEPLSLAELVAAFGEDTDLAENFLRSAVMVALADGAYSTCEDALLNQYCQALGLQIDILQVLRSALEAIKREDQSTIAPSSRPHTAAALRPPTHHSKLDPVRDWLDQMSIQDPKVARMLCRLIPPQCPFERDVTLFGHKVAHIPALCKLNPLYDQLVGLRFRALCYLADDCGEDVSSYC